MRTWKTRFVVLTLAITSVAGSPPALARGGHWAGHLHGRPFFGHRHVGGHWYGGFNFYGGSRFGWSTWPYAGPWYPGSVYPDYYAYPYYGPAYYPRPYIAQPPTYIERNAAGDWYYCRSARKYYPYVKECTGGWQRVSPQPAPSSTTTTPYYRDP